MRLFYVIQIKKQKKKTKKTYVIHMTETIEEE